MENCAYYWIKKVPHQKHWEIGQYMDSGGAFYPGLTDSAGHTYPGFLLVGTRIGIYADLVHEVGPRIIPPGE